MYKFTEREKVMLLVLAFFLLFVISWVYLIDPALKNLGSMRAELMSLEDNRIASQQLIMREDVMRESYENDSALIEDARRKLYMPMDAEEVDRRVTAMLLKHGLQPEALLIDLEGYQKAIQQSMENAADGQPDTINTFYTVTITARGGREGFRAMLDEVNNDTGLVMRRYSVAGVGDDSLIDLAIDIYIYDEERLDSYDMVIGPMVKD